MDKSRLIKLDETYEALVNTALFNLPLEKIRPHFDDQFMGYGTAEDENLSGWEGFKFMVLRQRKELGENQVTIKRIPMINQYHSNGKSAVKVEEFEMNTDTEEIQHRFKLRLSTILEFVDGKWMVRHFHGSTADADTPEGSAWPIEEWKRRNAELQKAVNEKTKALLLKTEELKIEASLERVRTTAMSMQKAEDLSTICEKIFLEMKGLGFNALRNTEIIINQDEKENIRSYYYSEYGVTGVVDLDCKSHPKILEWFHDLQKQEDAFSEVLISKAEMTEWEDFRQSLGYVPDPKLQESENIFYYSYSTGSGALSVSSFMSLDGKHIEMLKRFRNVFSLSYKRYEDIQLAEMQKREAQIEASLERVRARSMAMHSSDELGEVAKVMFDQMQLLGGDLYAFGVVLCDKYDDKVEQWHGLGDAGLMSPFYVPIDLDYIHRYRYDQWKTGVELFSIEIPSDYIQEHFELIFNLPSVQVVAENLASEGIELTTPPWEIDYGASFKHGYLLISSLSPFEEDHIFPRFANVFEQAYIRFLDLQKAEAQAREAQIELSLEKIRAQVTSMQESSDLFDIVVSMRNEFIALGHEADYFWHMRWSEDSYDMSMTSTEGDRLGMVITVPKFVHEQIDRLHKWEKSNHPYIVLDLDAEGAWDYLEKMNTYGHYEQMDPHAPGEEDIHHIGGLTFVIARTTHGEIGFSLAGKVPDPPQESIETLVRFAGVFDLAYRRFEDLKATELQHREAQIELALERVRARTMAMQKSEELPDVANILFLQVQSLGIPTWSAGYNILSDDKKISTCIMSSEGQVQAAFQLPLTGEKSFVEWHQAVLNEDEFFVQELGGEALEEHYKYLMSLPGIQDAVDPLEEAGISLPTFQVNHISLFKQGFLLFITYEQVSDAHEVFKRFTQVFEQTYTRFLDLKKAEAQAREAQVETALEKVRSMSMGMHSSEELKDVIKVIFNQLSLLDINAEHAGIVVDYKPKEDWTFWVAETQDIPSRINVPYLDSLWDRQYTEAKEKGMDFFTTQFNFEEKNRFYKNLLKHIPELTEEARDFYFSCAGLAISTAIEKDVGLYIENFSGTPYSEEENMVLKRCVKVFQQAYIRFLDLKRAEEQTRQAKIETALERVRARAMAMQEPEELKEVAQVLRTEMGKLDIAELETCSIYIKDPESSKAECWYAIKDIRGDETVLVKDQFKLDLEQTWVGREMLSFSDSQDERVSIVMKGDNRKEWMDYCEKHSKPLKGYYGDVIPERTYHLYKFSNGSIGFASAGDISEESWNILSRAASAFSLAFSRFQDLTKARLDLIKLKEEKKRAEEALSNLKEAQRQLIHAEKMASLGELTAGIAHEIQNPLNFVNNFSEVSSELMDEMDEEVDKGDLEEAKAISSDIKQNLEKIIHHGQRASSIVKGMLDHSRTSSGEKVGTDINALCDEYLRLAYHGLRAKDKDFNAAFKTDFDESLPKLNIVPQDIGRVMLNLINNAFYAVDEKKKSLTGLEALSEMEEYEPVVEVTTSQNEGRVIISVMDNGNGIPKDVVDKIFQPFFTTKPTGQGTGLGLSLSYDIVKAHRGELVVRSKEGKGTEFEISLLFS